MLALAKPKTLIGEIIGPDEDLQVIVINNPFDPRDHTVVPQPCGSNMTVADLLPTGVNHADYVVSVNGGIVYDMETTFLRPADRIVLCPIPQGGGGGSGKMVLRIVALLALTWFTLGAGSGALLGVFGAQAGTMAAFAIQAGAYVAGSMLINAMLPIKPPSTNSSLDSTSSQTYGIDGPKNASSEGLAVPICYGEFRMAGNIIGLYVENVDKTQMVYVLLNAGEGPVFRLDEIELNDQPIANFQNCEFVTRLGTGDQELIDWFADSFTPINVNVPVPHDQSYFTYTTSGSCDKLRFDFFCPQGIWKADKNSGALDSYTVPLEIQYRLLGAPTWVTLDDTSTVASSTNDDVPTTVTDVDPNDGTGTITYDTNAQKQTSEYHAATEITDKLRATVRRSFTTPQLVLGRYDVRIRRLTTKSTDDYIGDEVFVGDINLITASKVAYNWTSLVGVKIKLTDQMNGLPNITYKNHGRVVKIWNPSTRNWGYGNTKNPAWVVLDMLCHIRYGAQADESRLDIEQWKEWATQCDLDGLEWNGVFDQNNMSVWDAIQYVARIGHAQIVPVGTRYSIAMERADTPIMMFGVGNIKKASFKLNWLPQAERANEIAVTYWDKDDHYKQKTIKVYDPAILSQGKKQQTATLELFGCDNELTAVKEGVLQLNLNRYMLQTCEFDAPIEALACTVGSLIYVQHDMPVWEFSGRLDAGSTTTELHLDRAIDFQVGETYSALLLYPSLEVGAGTVSAIDAVNGYLLLSSAPPEKFKRINVGGRDRDCQKAQTTSNYVWVEDTTGISVGDAYTLYDTDVVVETPALNPGTTGVVTVTLTSALPAAPVQFTNWMIGPVSRVKRPFRVKSISAAGDQLERHLTCIQYDERVYDIDTSGYNGPAGTIGGPGGIGFALSQVTNLSTYEEVFVSGTQVKNRVVLAWTPPAYGIYKGADVYASVNDDAMKKLGEAIGAPRFNFDADIGSTITFKVVAFDMFDRRVNYDAAPTITYKVTGIADNPPVPRAPSGLRINWEGKDCKIYWRYNSLNNSYEIGDEPYGADSGFADPSVLDYEVKVWQNLSDLTPDTPNWREARTEYVTHPAFVYAWEMNSQDGRGLGPKRHLKFEVKVRMRIGEASLAARAEAYNAPPPPVSLVTRKVSWESAEIGFSRPGDTDFEGVLVYMSTVSPVDADNPANLIYDGPNNSIILTGLDFNTDYYAVAYGYDTFGKTGLQRGIQLTFHTTLFDIGVIQNNTIGIDLIDATLRSRIDLVDGDMAGSVNARILGEAADRGAAITAESSARQTADASITSTTNTLTAAIAGAGSAAAQSAILASVTASGGTASMIDALSVTVAGNHASVLSSITVLSNAQTSQATSITTLTSTVDKKNRTFYQDGAPVSDSSYTLVIGDTWVDTNDSNKTYRWSGSAWTYVENPEALKSRTFTQGSAPTSGSGYTLQTNDLWIDTSHGNLIMRWNGGAWEEVTDIRTANNTVAIQTVSSVTDGLSAQYTVKIDNNGFVTGFGLASAAVQNPDHTWRMASTFEVIADSFQVRMPSSTDPGPYPFTVGNYIDPVTHLTHTGVTVNAAFIQTASILSGHIVDGTIDDAKIGSFIKATSWDGTLDGSGNITAHGSNGWVIAKSGAAEFQNVHIRGTSKGSVVLANNEQHTVAHNLGRYPIVVVWRSGGNGVATLSDADTSNFTVELTSSSGGTVSWIYF